MVDSSQSPELIKAQVIDAAKRVAVLLEQQGDHAGAREHFESTGTRVDGVIKIVGDDKAERADWLRGALSWLLATLRPIIARPYDCVGGEGLPKVTCHWTNGPIAAGPFALFGVQAASMRFRHQVRHVLNRDRF